MDKDKDMINMSIENFVKEFNNLNSNKFSKEQTISIFLGTLFQLITDKKIFKLNIDIQKFLEDVLKKEYKDYLFRSRSYLTSRVLADIKKEKSYRELVNLSTKIADYLNENNELKQSIIKNNSGKKIEDSIVGWVNQVNKKIEE
ncbi:hypothetical protein [Trichococcus ilyis]|uniref:Uncharacterized protein n=1 Tax=Trichococcus ilyis TaxID=640938 RepID=A0A143Z6X5_9LACT|nr:hypothetical protein [Trichococcus ilyis]CZR09470.1 Hypothetical protein TR210_2728 [Trichococcus ilyis]SEJ96313.1 hypothetical protein SAMN05216375_1487 [Trichococcus ilyis]